MKKCKQRVTEENVVRYFDPIPDDVLIKIFSRLPTKAMAQCRCVSKLWSSIIRGQNYKQLFPIKSQDPSPRFLFTFLVEEKKLIFLTSPQPQVPVNQSSFVAIRHDTKSLVTDIVYKLCHPVGRLVCCQHIGKNYTSAMICNPVTGEYVTTPKVMMEDIESRAECYFGYDQINKQFKVLCVMSFFCQRSNKVCLRHRVLTLESGNLVWRKIRCHRPYFTLNSLDGICINGVLYYTAKNKRETRMIVTFDVNTEKFRFIKLDIELGTKRKIDRPLVLINYKGKLCVFEEEGRYDLFKLWVLEDAEKGTWSLRVYQTPLHSEMLSSMCINSAKVVGMTDSDDVVLCQKYAVKYPYYISYYNLESEVMVRVRVDIPGFHVLKSLRIYASPNYVEDCKFMI